MDCDNCVVEDLEGVECDACHQEQHRPKAGVAPVRVERLVILRCCASCEWIFKATDGNPTCPKCEFGSYGARYVYGDRCYRYAKTQKPWLDKKMFAYESKLLQEVKAI